MSMNWMGGLNHKTHRYPPPIPTASTQGVAASL